MTEREALESTYWDKMTIIRRMDIPDPDTHLVRQTDTEIAKDISCALSVNKLGSLMFLEGRGQVQSNFKLFCAPDVPVCSGDLLKVTTEAGQFLELWAGRPFCYSNSHAEVPLWEET